jgi:uncharacterized protein (TIGR02301 family)
MNRPAATLAAFLALAAPALAQERPPDQRQTLLELAYVLGQSHALRQACSGPHDQYWRGRMTDLLAAEAPEAAFAVRLRTAFNNGYVATEAAYPACSPASRRAEAKAGAHGRALAGALAGGSPETGADAPEQ